jgi:hypothetical protein
LLHQVEEENEGISANQGISHSLATIQPFHILETLCLNAENKLLITTRQKKNEIPWE